MKRLGKYKAVIALLCFTATIFSGCRKKPDAVITDGADRTIWNAGRVLKTLRRVTPT